MIKAYFDGSCEPVNPGGTAKYGVAIFRDGILLTQFSGVIGSGEGMTNNLAEYHGLINLLKYVTKNYSNEEISVYGDSQLVCHMVNKVWGMKKKKWVGHRASCPHLQALLISALELISGRKNIRIEWIPREQNEYADGLSKL